MAPRDGRSTARSGALVLALLLVGSILTGCLASPSTELSARRGDLAEIELVVADGDRVLLPAGNATTVTELCGDALGRLDEDGCPQARAPYALLAEPPAHLPEGFEEARGLTDALVAHLEGLAERETRLGEEVRVWGPHREGLVREHERRQTVPRVVDGPQAYGQTWNGTRLEDGRFRIDPEPGDEGIRLEVSDWCNERFCLFGSRLVDWNQTHLVVEHQAQEGEQVHVRSLDTFLTVVDAGEETFTVDGNDPRAGETYTVYAKIVDLRGPSEGQRRAPSFDLTTLEGERIRLADLLGQPVVLEFFATWCPSCRENAEHLTEVRDRFGGDVAIVSIGVDPWESTESLASFVEEHDVTWPVAVDEQGEVSNDYGVGTLSTEVLVDAHGTIRHVETGVADHERVVGVLEELVDEAETGGSETGGEAPG